MQQEHNNEYSLLNKFYLFLLEAVTIILVEVVNVSSPPFSPSLLKPSKIQHIEQRKFWEYFL